MKPFRLIAGALMLCLGSSVSAAEFHVKVVDRITGFPVENASVCLGTVSSTDHYGSVRTDENGIASFQAPVWRHRVSVSGNGYNNLHIEQPGRRYAFQLELRVEPGRGAPECWVAPEATRPRAGIAITEVDVIKSDPESGRLEIRTQTAGHTPTHVRVASRADFAGSSWQSVSAGRSVHYVRNMKEGLFVQVRRRVGTETQHIESVSDVVTETL